MQDLTGQKFNKLTVIKFSHFDKKKNSYWLCKCDCGNEKIVRRCHLIKGGVQSCGCVLKEGRGTYKNGWRTHGLWSNNRRLCKIWNCMLDRCLNENNEKYKYYGGKGVKVCNEWLSSFDNFIKWAQDNGYEDNLTIDRISTDGDYCPENCRCVTQLEQANNKSNNIYITYNQKTMTAAQWSKKTGIDRGVIEYRFHQGWNVNDILNPKKAYSPNRTFLTYNNETRSITSWAKLLGIKLEKLKKLLKSKSFEEICKEYIT